MKSKIILGLMLVTSNALLAVPQYSITALGTLGGDESYANDINDYGQIVGKSHTSEGIFHAFVSTEINGTRVITDLGSLSEGNENPLYRRSRANAINNHGQIVGDFGAPFSHAFISEKLGDTWVMTDLHPYAKLGVEFDLSAFAEAGREEPEFSTADIEAILRKSVATDINDSAQISGTGWGLPAGIPSVSVFVAYKNNTDWLFTSVFPVMPVTSIVRQALINNFEQVTYANTGYSEKAIFATSINDTWNRTEIASENYIYSITGINDVNQIIGNYHPNQKTAFIATKVADEWILLDIKEFNAHDINDSGVVVGYHKYYEYQGGNSYSKSLVYIDEKKHDLMDLIGTGLDGWTELTQAKNINNVGQIVGEGIYNGKTMAYLLTPIPESLANCDIGVDPKIIKKGYGTALWWWTEDTLSAQMNNGIGNVELPSNYQWVTPEESTTYRLSVTGTDGLTTFCKAEIIVEGICEVGADPQIIKKGEGTALWWWTENITDLKLLDFWGTLSPTSDFLWLTPEETITYKMTAKNSVGFETTCETTVIVE